MILSLALAHWRLAILAGLAAAAALALGLWRAEIGHAARLQGQLDAARAGAASAQAQAAAGLQAAAVAAAGARRDAWVQDQHRENQDAIQSATGSDQSLDPQLNAAGRRGLCQFAVYRADPACISLLGSDPGQRPQSGDGDAPAAR